MAALANTTAAGQAPGRRIAVWLAIIVATVYTLSALAMPADGFWIYDTALKFIQVRALAETGQFALDWPGRVLDPELAFGPLRRGFFALRGEELHAAYSPIFPLMATPFYLLLGTRGLAVLPLLGGVLVVPAVWMLAGLAVSQARTRLRVQVGSVVVTAFATPIWFYALAFWEHSLAVALACFAVFACVRDRQAAGPRSAAWVGMLAALPIYFRPENYLFALVVLAFAAWPRRRQWAELLMLGGGCGVALLPLWGFHTLWFGHPLGLHIVNQPWGDVSFVQYLAERGQVASRLLFNLHASSALSFAAGVPFYLALLLGWRARASWSKFALPLAGVAAIVSGVVVLWGYLAAPRPMNWMIAANGLFAGSPVLILAFLAPMAATQSSARRARTVILGIVLVFVGVYTVFIPEVNSRGIHWGCRFFLCVYPLLAVLAVSAVVDGWERFSPSLPGRVILAAAILLSFGLQLYSLGMLQERKVFVKHLNEQVSASEAEVIVTDLWFVPIDLANVFFEKPIFFDERLCWRRSSRRAWAVCSSSTGHWASARPRVFAWSPMTGCVFHQ